MSITKAQQINGMITYTVSINGVIIGLVVKARDTRATKNPWKAYKGIGADATFVGYSFESQAAAVQMVVA